MEMTTLTDQKRKLDGKNPGKDRPGPDGRRNRNLIDQNIRRVYEDLLEDEVPDRFTKLLEQLREQDSRKDDTS